jgi:hypothetical protein
MRKCLADARDREMNAELCPPCHHADDDWQRRLASFGIKVIRGD